MAHLDIYGRKVPIKVKKDIIENGHPCHGTYCDQTHTIEVNDLQDDQTLIHEGFHAMVARLKIELPPDKEEQLANAVDTYITENWHTRKKKKK